MTTRARDWYRVTNSVGDPSIVDIHIIDFIGDWSDDRIGQIYGLTLALTAKSFIDQLAALPANVTTIRLHINSPGGDVFGAANIANALRDQQLSKGRIVAVFIDGLAASAASVIAMAGSTVTMADNALLMIHNPWSVAVGDAKDMQQAAETLNAIRNTIVATYQWHSPLDAEAIVALMDAETWMDADAAIANGFATDKVTGLKAAASIDRRALNALTIPASYRARVQAFLKPVEIPAPAPVAATTDDIFDACEAGGCPELVKSFRGTGATLEQVTTKVAEAKAGKIAATVRADAITAICAKHKQSELIKSYIDGGMPVDAIKAQLVVITAKQDQVEINSGLMPDGAATSRGRDPFGVFGKDTKE